MPKTTKGKVAPPKSRTSGQSAQPGDEKSLHGETGKTADMVHDIVDPGEIMTGNQGLKISDDQNSLKAGVRGPTLMEDFHLREKITHFDHERIPERVVHARGTAAHGIFQVYEDLSDLSKAGLLTDPSRKTPVFVRFSTVAGSRGSSD
jgi:catalase